MLLLFFPGETSWLSETLLFLTQNCWWKCWDRRDGEHYIYQFFNNYPSYLITTSLGKHFPATSKLMCFLLHFVRFINLTSGFWKDMCSEKLPMKRYVFQVFCIARGKKGRFSGWDSPCTIHVLAPLLTSYISKGNPASLCLSFSSVRFFEEQPKLCQKMIHNNKRGPTNNSKSGRC